FPVNSQGTVVGQGQPAVQTEKVVENLVLVLKEAHSGLGQLLKVNVTVTRAEIVPEVQKVFARTFREARPAASFVVGHLSQPDALVAVDAVALTMAPPSDVVKPVRMAGLSPERPAQAAILPAGARLYVSGQAEKGKDVAEATRRTLASLRATLTHLGRSEADVV